MHEKQKRIERLEMIGARSADTSNIYKIVENKKTAENGGIKNEWTVEYGGIFWR